MNHDEIDTPIFIIYGYALLLFFIEAILLVNIQYLRFLAAFVVIFSHANLQHFGMSPSVTNTLGIGVDIFFVISGFIIPYVIFSGGTESIVKGWDFFIRRVIRIIPLLILSMLLVVVISYAYKLKLFPNATADFAYIFNDAKTSFSWFIQTVTFTNFNKPPLLSVVWTLQLEFIFYSIVVIFLWIGIKKLELMEVCFLIFVIFIVILSKAYPLLQSVFSQVYFPMLFEFSFGICLYRLYAKKILLGKVLSIMIIFLFFPVYFYLVFSPEFASLEYFRVIVQGGLSFLLVWAALSIEGVVPKNRLFIVLGDSSYSLYLTHALVSPCLVFFLVSNDLMSKLNLYTYILMYVVICNLVALLVHYYFEKPVNRFIKKRLAL